MNDESFERELAEKLAGKVKGLAKKAGKKILISILPTLAVIIPVFVALLMIIGAADSFVEAVSEQKNESGISIFEGMSEEEIAKWMDDPENIYNAFEEGTLDLDGANLLMLDEDTTKRIFERIHEWQVRRDMKKTATYTFRTESKYDEDDNPIPLEEMDVYGTIPKDSTSAAFGVSYSGRKSVTIERGAVEKEVDESGRSIFDIRWQPIYALCTIAVNQNFDNWESYRDVDNDSKLMEDMDLKNYYLSDEQIDNIIDVFYYNADYYYDAIEDGITEYKFKDMVKGESAFKLIESEGDRFRVTQRVPCSAPHTIANAYIRYDYQYDSNGKCISRMYTCTPTSFISACEAVAPGFEMDWFLEVLDILPGSEDLYEFFTTEEFQNMMIVNTYCTDPKLCPTIGVIYHKSNGSNMPSDSGEKITFEGSFTIPYYDYINPNTKHLGNVYFIADNKPDGADYGLYEISNAALKPFTQSDGLTAEQLANIISRSSYHKNAGAKGCILFDTQEHINKTAQVLADYQDEQQVSPLFYLAIMRTEGAIQGRYGIQYYNFFNFTNGTYTIPNSKGFRDFKSEYPDPWDALKVQLGLVYEKYAVNRGQINYYQMIWQGYDGVSYSSLKHAYCPPYDDPSMPWASGSYYNNGNGNVNVAGGIGWVNSNASYRSALESIARDLGYELTPFGEDNITSETIGGGLYDWLKVHLPGIFGGGDEEQSEAEGSGEP